MTQAQKYERNIDFTDRDGNDTDHAGLNAEFDAVGLSVNGLRTNLAKIQGDDGGLAKGVVTGDSLADSAFDKVAGQVLDESQKAIDASIQAAASAATAIDSRDQALAAKTKAETAQVASGLNAATAANEAAQASTASANAEAAAVRASNSATVAASASSVAVSNATESNASALLAQNSATSAMASAASATQSATSASTSSTSASAAAARAETAANNITNSPGNTYSKPEIDALLGAKAPKDGVGTGGNWPIKSESSFSADNSAQLGGVPAANFAIKTGANASGTWPIDISGKAKSVESVAAAQVGSASASMAVDDVGAYAMLLWFPISGSAWNPTAGSIVTQGLNATLLYGPAGNGSPPSGSRWMICGSPIYAGPSASGDVANLRRTSLFKRVA